MEQFVNALLLAGALVLLYVLIEKHRKRSLSIKTWILSLLSISLIPFGLAWGLTSLYESETQAAIIGVVFFTGIGTVLGILAWPGLFPESKRKLSIPLKGTGKGFITGFLMFLTALTFPLSLVLRDTLNIVTDQEKVIALLDSAVVSDEALPVVTKKALIFETLHGNFPDKFEFRALQALFSKVENKEIARFAGYIITEQERKKLSSDAVNAVAEWASSDVAYPQLSIPVSSYLQCAHTHAEDIARWIYGNLEFPPMPPEQLEPFVNGEFSEVIDDYMGTPPDSLKETLIPHFAHAIRLQLTKADAPTIVHVAEEMQKEMKPKQMQENKSQVKALVKALRIASFLPLILLLTSLFLAYNMSRKALMWCISIVLGLSGLFGHFVYKGIETLPGTIEQSEFVADLPSVPGAALSQLSGHVCQGIHAHSAHIWIWMLIAGGALFGQSLLIRYLREKKNRV